MDEVDHDRLRCLFCGASFETTGDLFAHAAKEHMRVPDVR